MLRTTSSGAHDARDAIQRGRGLRTYQLEAGSKAPRLLVRYLDDDGDRMIGLERLSDGGCCCRLVDALGRLDAAGQRRQ